MNKNDSDDFPWRRWALRVVLAGLGLVGLAVLWCYGTAAMWLVSRHEPIGVLHLGTWFDAWQQSAAGSAERRSLTRIAVIATCALAGAALAASTRAKAERALYGEARFATDADIRRAGLFAAEGVVVGKAAGRFVVFGGEKFVLVAAPTRSGKGVSIVIPNLLTFSDSVVVLDIKQENFQRTAGFRAAHGHAVFLFNPFATDRRTHRYNPLGYISEDPGLRVGDTLAIGESLYPHQDRDPFWNDSARNLFLGVVLYLLETPKQVATLGAVLRAVSAAGISLSATLGDWIDEARQENRPLSSACESALQRFRTLQGASASGVIASFLAPLAPWANPLLDLATSENDFDLRELRRTRMTVYVGVAPDRISQARLLLNLLFSQLIQLNTRTLPEQDATLRYQCLLLIDEFTAVGRIAPLADAIAFIAGYHLRLVTIVQSIAQLESVYGPNGARTLMTNHALQVIFAPREQRDADAYSLALGTFTQEIETSRRNAPAWGARGSRSMGTQTSLHERALMLPQELRELPANQTILLLEGARPMRVSKVCYYTDRLLRDRQMPAPAIAQLVEPSPFPETSRRRPKAAVAASETLEEDAMARSRSGGRFEDLSQADSPEPTRAAH